jgi:hypothetical protein
MGLTVPGIISHIWDMTLLSDWLSTNKRTDEWLAAQIKRERSTVTKIKNGRIGPSASTIARIEVATGGQVTASDHVRAMEQARGGVAA